MPRSPASSKRRRSRARSASAGMLPPSPASLPRRTETELLAVPALRHRRRELDALEVGRRLEKRDELRGGVREPSQLEPVTVDGEVRQPCVGGRGVRELPEDWQRMESLLLEAPEGRQLAPRALHLGGEPLGPLDRGGQAGDVGVERGECAPLLHEGDGGNRSTDPQGEEGQRGG